MAAWSAGPRTRMQPGRLPAARTARAPEPVYTVSCLWEGGTRCRPLVSARRVHGLRCGPPQATKRWRLSTSSSRGARSLRAGRDSAYPSAESAPAGRRTLFAARVIDSSDRTRSSIESAESVVVIKLRRARTTAAGSHGSGPASFAPLFVLSLSGKLFQIFHLLAGGVCNCLIFNKYLYHLV